MEVVLVLTALIFRGPHHHPSGSGAMLWKSRFLSRRTMVVATPTDFVLQMCPLRKNASRRITSLSKGTPRPFGSWMAAALKSPQCAPFRALFLRAASGQETPYQSMAPSQHPFLQTKLVGHGIIHSWIELRSQYPCLWANTCSLGDGIASLRQRFGRIAQMSRLWMLRVLH